MYQVTMHDKFTGRKVTNHANINSARSHVINNRGFLGEWKQKGKGLVHVDGKNLFAEVVYVDDRAARQARQVRFMTQLAKRVGGSYDAGSGTVVADTKAAEAVISSLGWERHRNKKRTKVWHRNHEWYVAVYANKIVFISEMHDPAFDSVMDNRACSRRFHAVLDDAAHKATPEYVFEMAVEMETFVTVAEAEHYLEMVDTDGVWIVQPMLGSCGGR